MTRKAENVATNAERKLAVTESDYKTNSFKTVTINCVNLGKSCCNS